jgi:phosphoserine phosphatase
LTTVTTEAVHLTTAEFHSRVHRLAPRVAVFDCDGTLWSGDAGSSFMRWTIEQNVLTPDAGGRLTQIYNEYKRGTVSELAICGEMVQVYAGLPVAALRSAAAEFFRTHIEPDIFPEMLELVTELQRNGCDIWAVSSTNDWVIEEGVTRFHISADHVLAARVEADSNGIITRKLIDVPTDQGKVAALHRAGITAPDAVFGNSVHDAAMLAIARSQHGISGAFPVNPSAELLRRSAAEGWPVYFPSSVRP